MRTVRRKKTPVVRRVVLCVAVACSVLVGVRVVAQSSGAASAPSAAASAASAPRSGIVNGDAARRRAKAPAGAASGAGLESLKPVEVGPPIILYAGEVQVINRADVLRLAIGKGSLVNATVVDDRQVVLIGEAPGETTLHTWLKNGRQIRQSVVVHSGHTGRLADDLTAMLSRIPGIQVRQVADKVFIEGRYPNAEAAAQVKAIAASFPSVVNLVPERALEGAALLPQRMIQLDLRVIEVRKRALEQLGIKWAGSANGPTFATSALGYSNTPWRPTDHTGYPQVNTGNPVATFFGLATQITSALQFLEETGDSWTIAEPRLSCRSGGLSKFVAGGEVPIPVSTGLGQTSVTYKQYGVVIEFKPVADEHGQIETGIKIEVSEPDTRNSNQGFVAFTTNRTETEVALKQNEPLVISGLLRRTGAKSLDGIPGLGKLPVLGNLFSSREFRNEQTELLVVVTPRIVDPASETNQAGVEQGKRQAAAIDAMIKSRLAE